MVKPLTKPPTHILPMVIEYVDFPPMRIVKGTVRVTIGPKGDGLTRIGQIVRYSAPALPGATITHDYHLQWPSAWPIAIASQLNKANEAHIIKTWMALRHFYLFARGKR